VCFFSGFFPVVWNTSKRPYRLFPPRTLESCSSTPYRHYPLNPLRLSPSSHKRDFACRDPNSCCFFCTSTMSSPPVSFAHRPLCLPLSEPAPHLLKSSSFGSWFTVMPVRATSFFGMPSPNFFPFQKDFFPFARFSCSVIAPPFVCAPEAPFFEHRSPVTSFPSEVISISRPSLNTLPLETLNFLLAYTFYVPPRILLT